MAAVAYNATIVVNHPVHMKLKNGATTHRETLWVESVSGQAMARNTIFPLGQNVFLDARAGTRRSSVPRLLPTRSLQSAADSTQGPAQAASPAGTTLIW